MRCPHCGATVNIRGRQWECGFCGDFGVLSAQQLTPTQEEPAQITISFSLSYEVNLSETWSDLKAALQRATGNPSVSLHSKLGAAVIYEICHALSDPKRMLPSEKKEELEQFLTHTADLGPVPSVDTLLAASRLPMAKQELEVYSSIGQLSESVCGSFWTDLIQHLPSEDDLEQMDDLFACFGQINQYFASDEWDGQDYDRKIELRDAFESQWYRNKYLLPDIDQAMGRLLSGDDSRLDDDCRDVLVTMFPEYFRNFTIDELIDLDWSDLISDLLDSDRSLGLAMWQALLDSSKPGFLEEQSCAQYVLEQL